MISDMGLESVTRLCRGLQVAVSLQRTPPILEAAGGGGSEEGVVFSGQRRQL